MSKILQVNVHLTNGEEIKLDNVVKISFANYLNKEKKFLIFTYPHSDSESVFIVDRISFIDLEVV